MQLRHYIIIYSRSCLPVFTSAKHIPGIYGACSVMERFICSVAKGHRFEPLHTNVTSHSSVSTQLSSFSRVNIRPYCNQEYHVCLNSNEVQGDSGVQSLSLGRHGFNSYHPRRTICDFVALWFDEASLPASHSKGCCYLRCRGWYIMLWRATGLEPADSDAAPSLGSEQAAAPMAHHQLSGQLHNLVAELAVLAQAAHGKVYGTVRARGPSQEGQCA